jgi:hypothetical protein
MTSSSSWRVYIIAFLPLQGRIARLCTEWALNLNRKKPEECSQGAVNGAFVEGWA